MGEMAALAGSSWPAPVSSAPRRPLPGLDRKTARMGAWSSPRSPGLCSPTSRCRRGRRAGARARIHPRRRGRRHRGLGVDRRLARTRRAATARGGDARARAVLDASRIDLRALRDGYAVPAWLLGIGLPLTIVAGTVAAIVVLPQLAVAEAVVLAIACGHRRRARPGRRDRRTPAGVDPPGAQRRKRPQRRPLRPGARNRAGTRGHRARAQRIAAGRVVAESIGYGLLMGAVAGLAAAAGAAPRRTEPRRGARAVALAADTRWSPRWRSPAAPLGGSGFIAAFVAGIVFGAVRNPARSARRCRRRTSARC